MTPDLRVPLASLALKELKETPVLWARLDPGGRKVTEDYLALRGCPACLGEMAVLAWQEKLVKKDQKVTKADLELVLQAAQGRMGRMERKVCPDYRGKMDLKALLARSVSQV